MGTILVWRRLPCRHRRPSSLRLGMDPIWLAPSRSGKQSTPSRSRPLRALRKHQTTRRKQSPEQSPHNTGAFRGTSATDAGSPVFGVIKRPGSSALTAPSSVPPWPWTRRKSSSPGVRRESSTSQTRTTETGSAKSSIRRTRKNVSAKKPRKWHGSPKPLQSSRAKLKKKRSSSASRRNKKQEHSTLRHPRPADLPQTTPPSTPAQRRHKAISRTVTVSACKRTPEAAAARPILTATVRTVQSETTVLCPAIRTLNPRTTLRATSSPASCPPSLQPLLLPMQMPPPQTSQTRTNGATAKKGTEKRRGAAAPTALATTKLRAISRVRKRRRRRRGRTKTELAKMRVPPAATTLSSRTPSRLPRMWRPLLKLLPRF
mmetsp:Transcript_13610/g.43485  ORF Transcript_13610/g.43485 Transcript_13610/m.43485 type:complete len:374 (-) Transcript_13610:487-1608(-)